MRNRVLGVDPGFDRLGVAILEDDKVLHSECITTDKRLSHEERLLEVGLSIRRIIKKWQPEALAIETLFFSVNAKSAMGVAEARGVVLYEAAGAGLAVREYSPQAVKIAVTGYGAATKPQVESMVKKLVVFPSKSTRVLDDEMDAIALGITHLASLKGI